MNVEPTAEIIDDMAEKMVYYAEQMRRVAAKMREHKDLSYAAEAINTVTNCVQNLRLDLLVARPVRELQR